MVEWHHRLNGHEFEQAPGDGEGQGSLACFSPWGCKEQEMTEQITHFQSTNQWALFQHSEIRISGDWASV